MLSWPCGNYAPMKSVISNLKTFASADLLSMGIIMKDTTGGVGRKSTGMIIQTSFEYKLDKTFHDQVIPQSSYSACLKMV